MREFDCRAALIAHIDGRPEIADIILRHCVEVPAPRVIIITDREGNREYELEPELELE